MPSKRTRVAKLKGAQQALERAADRKVPYLARLYSALVSRMTGKGYFALPKKKENRKGSKNWPLLRRIALICLRNRIEPFLFFKANFEIGKRRYTNIPYPYLNVIAANGIDVYNEWLDEQTEIDPEFVPRVEQEPRVKRIEGELVESFAVMQSQIQDVTSPSKRLDFFIRFAGTLSPLFLVLQPEVLDALDDDKLDDKLAGELVRHQLDMLASDDGLSDDLIAAWGKVENGKVI